MADIPTLCNGDCNHCPIIMHPNNRMVTKILNQLLVKFGDVAGLAQAIHRLMQNDSLRRELGQQGQDKLATEYTWEHVADRVLMVYQRMS